jgi:hypothetical protein
MNNRILSRIRQRGDRGHDPPAFLILGIGLDHFHGILLETFCPVIGAAPDGMEKG